MISLALLCASKRRYAARIFACARSNTANPESLPEIPSAQPLAWLIAYSTPWQTRFHADGGQHSKLKADTCGVF